MTLLSLILGLQLPFLSISKVGDEAWVTVMSREAWTLEASTDMTNWVELVSGPASNRLFDVTVVRDNAAQAVVVYRLR